MEDYLNFQNVSQSSKNTIKNDNCGQIIQYDKLIQTYFNTQVFYQDEIESGNQFQKKRNNKNDEAPLEHEQTLKFKYLMIKKEIRPKKSIFHNFQKHLITTLKRYIVINNKQQTDQINQTAYQIWSAFTKTNSHNKKLLQLVFGVSCPKNKNEEEILKILSVQFPYFKDLISIHQTNIVLSAQELLRTQVSEQARHLTFVFLKSKCHITKFADFYTYFCEFMREIREGPISRRMSKSKSIELRKNSKLYDENVNRQK